MRVEQAGPGQRMRRRAQGADLGPVPVVAPEPGEHVPILVALGADAAADDDGRPHARHGLAVAHGCVDLDRDAVAGRDRKAVPGDQLPAVELAPGLAVRQPQRLDRTGEGHHREAGDEEEEQQLGPGLGRRWLGTVALRAGDGLDRSDA